jgi:hypothetical protein
VARGEVLKLAVKHLLASLYLVLCLAGYSAHAQPPHFNCLGLSDYCMLGTMKPPDEFTPEQRERLEQNNAPQRAECIGYLEAIQDIHLSKGCPGTRFEDAQLIATYRDFLHEHVAWWDKPADVCATEAIKQIFPPCPENQR